MTKKEAKDYLIALCESSSITVNEGMALIMAIKSLESLQTISNLFSKWQNGEVDDNEYFFQMQNILLFGKTLESKDGE